MYIHIYIYAYMYIYIYLHMCILLRSIGESREAQSMARGYEGRQARTCCSRGDALILSGTDMQAKFCPSAQIERYCRSEYDA